MNKFFYLIAGSSLITTTFLTSLNNPALSQKAKCEPLAVVGGEGTSVTKSVSGPGVVAGNNYNTDFSVPNNSTFSKYIATLKSDSKDPGDFEVKMFLKYANDTVDQTFEGNVQLPPGQAKELTGSPRQGQQPYQVNLSVGGVDVIGYSYTLSVVGCK